MQLLGGEWLQLREVEVIDQNGVNMALKKVQLSLAFTKNGTQLQNQWTVKRV